MFIWSSNSSTRALSFQIVPLGPLLERVIQLARNRSEAKGVSLESKVEPASLELTADSDPIEQVIPNLLINGMHALEGHPDAVVQLKAEMGGKGSVAISV